MLTISDQKKTKELRRRQLEDEANRFISENNDEILYIPFCLMAKAYDSHHKFSRRIYNAYDVLNVEVQAEVLRQLGYDHKPIKGNTWIEGGLKTVSDFIKENDLGRDYLYDDYKYFWAAMQMPGLKWELRYSLGLFMPDLFGSSSAYNSWGFKQGHISFQEYLKDYLERKNGDQARFASIKDKRPIDVLADIVDFPICQDSQICYWVMEIVDSVAKVWTQSKCGDNSCFEVSRLSKGDAEIQTFEDRCLSVLMTLYNMHIISVAVEGSKKNRRTKKKAQKKE